jgi:hypothetical protein
LFLIARSVVFLGKNLEPIGAGGNWYFQDSHSYCVYGPHDFSEPFEKEVTREEFAKVAAKTLPTTFVILGQDNLCQVVDCEGLAKAASECAMRRAGLGKST